jgi:hypothetical protein
MPVTNWTTTTIDGKEYLVIDTAKFRIPLDWDPSSNMFIAVAAPDGGLGSFPGLVQGDPGPAPVIDTAINFTALPAGDPTPDSASWTKISTNMYKLNLAVHAGPKGDAASFKLVDADDLAGTPTAGKIIVASGTSSGFEYAAQKVGDEYWPAMINNTPTGNSAYTLCQVSIPPQQFAWRPQVSGWCVISGTGSDVQVDLIARLNDQGAGKIMGRGRGRIGQNADGFSTVLSSGPPAGSPADYNKIAAGAAATIFLRAERQSGSQTFSTVGSATAFSVRVCPVSDGSAVGAPFVARSTAGSTGSVGTVGSGSSGSPGPVDGGTP